MNQIPNEGEYCGDCPCSEFILEYGNKCQLFNEHLNFDSKACDTKRLPQCLSDRPQIVKGKE